jgi:DNA-binding CsgD family transcriptional regulator
MPLRRSSTSGPKCAYSQGFPGTRAGYSSVTLQQWRVPRRFLNRVRGHCFTPQLPRTPVQNSHARTALMRALDHLNAAFDVYMRLEAFADARRVARELRGLGVERRIVTHQRARTGWDSLTDSELKVVNLIAMGTTNRDVAAQLHLSIHTVKTHLHNAFAKLGITSRAQLMGLMRATE